MARMTCPKCQAAMLEGFTLEHTHGENAVSRWREGAPKKSFWFGVVLDDAKPLEITTWRCSSCGFLENYAKPQ